MKEQYNPLEFYYDKNKKDLDYLDSNVFGFGSSIVSGITNMIGSGGGGGGDGLISNILGNIGGGKGKKSEGLSMFDAKTLENKKSAFDMPDPTMPKSTLEKNKIDSPEETELPGDNIPVTGVVTGAIKLALGVTEMGINIANQKQYERDLEHQENAEEANLYLSEGAPSGYSSAAGGTQITNLHQGYAEGGTLDSFDIVDPSMVNNPEPVDLKNEPYSVDAGGTHQTNTIGGVPMGTGSNGKPNLVEEDEILFTDSKGEKRVLSNRIY